MKYTYIELNHYTRMPLTDSEHFSMVIENPIQMILGTNGSGKSSLVKELTPFPPNPSDYFKTGSKIIKIEHNNNLYTLKTIFSPSTKHSFFVNDDTNLNEGGTLTVQKDLIRSHFNITQEINDLIHDEELFTEMSPSRRKEWLISLCDTDYSYAIRAYNKLKEKHRDTLGAIKISKKRLATEVDKVLKSDEEAILHNQVSELHTLLSNLLEYRKPVESDTATLDMEIDSLNNKLYRAASHLQQIMDTPTPYSDYTLEQLTSLSLNIQKTLYSYNIYLDDYTKRYTENEKKIEILDKAEQNTIDSLEKDIELAISNINRLKSTTLVECNDNAKHALDIFQKVKSLLVEITTAIPENTDRKYSSDALKNNQTLLSETQLKKQKLLEDISNHKAKLKHLLDHKNSSLITCVKCHHNFSLVYSDKAADDLETQLIDLDTQLQNTNTQITSTQKTVEDILEYSALYRQYINITKSTPQLNSYWEYLRENNVITNAPREAVHHFNKFESDLNTHIEIQFLQDKVNKDTQLLKSLKEVGTQSLQSLVETNKNIFSMVATLTNKIASSTLKLNQINKIIEKRKTIETLKLSIESLFTKHTEYTKDYIETMRRTTLNNLIKQLQSELGSKEHILMLASNQKSVINNIEEQIKDLELDNQALTALINSLSPTDGLIAQGLLGFINNYISQMNEFIDKVWAYPMVIGSCDVQDTESLDLNYKFPVQSRNNKSSPDISKCSRGMKEIINLAFKITAMKYMNLLDTPLYLDEFGSAMDNGHRNEVISLIKTFSEQRTFSQMFIVSHDVTQYSSLPNAQVCVICNDNIITPQHYNEHVTMK